MMSSSWKNKQTWAAPGSHLYTGGGGIVSVYSVHTYG